MITRKRPREMKAWQDCQWLRVPCGKEQCPICGPIIKSRAEHIAKGEDPDTIECALMEVSRNFKEMLKLLHADAEKHGIDLEKEEQIEMPEDKSLPTDYPLYNKIMDWRQGIYEIVEESDACSEAWLHTDAGKDLLWYSNTLLAKTYSQLMNVDGIKNKEKFLELEYAYTGYVLGAVLDIIDKALLTLSTHDGTQAGQFTIARLSFDAIKKEIIDYGKTELSIES
jgi:hypothetical protein